MNSVTNINLKTAKMPKMIGELVHSNQFLKVFSLSALVLVLMALGVMLVMATKDPMVITLGPDGKAIERTLLPKAEDQIREGIKRYLNKRYQWGPEDVKKKLKDAEEFIHPSKLKVFQMAATAIQRFSTEKSVSQKVYPETIQINLKKKTAFIKGDRVTSIQGLRAAGDLKLELAFEFGNRTYSNPWGIYISKETEE